jgi:hypothetical protein
VARIPDMPVKLTNHDPRSQELKRSFDEIRSTQNLRELTDEEDGSDSLPVGVYGFTDSPCADNFPFFKAHDLRSYEAHKHSDGSVVLLGFLTADEQKALETATGVSTLHLFPEPKDEADQLVQIPLSRVQNHVENSQRGGGSGLAIEIASEG